MKTVYGYDVNPDGDQFVGLVDRALESVRITGNVGTFLVDYIPSLKYLPRESWLTVRFILILTRSCRVVSWYEIYEPCGRLEKGGRGYARRAIYIRCRFTGMFLHLPSSSLVTLTRLQNNGTAPSSLVSVNLAKMKNISVSEKKTHLEVIRNTAGVAFAVGSIRCFLPSI